MWAETKQPWKVSYHYYNMIVCTVILFVLIIQSNPEKNITFELEKTTYEDNSHDYEAIAKVRQTPTGTGGFDVNQCAAYVPIPEL